MVGSRIRVLAAAASLTCNGLGASIFSAAATPAWCRSNCDHAQASNPTIVMLRLFHGASAGRGWGAALHVTEIPFVYNGAPYIIARATGRVGVHVPELAELVPPCADADPNLRLRLLVAPKPFGLPRSTIDAPQPVIACIRVARRGYVEDVVLSPGTGDAALDARLLDLIRAQWLFDPAIENGRTIATRVRVRINPDRPDPASGT